MQTNLFYYFHLPFGVIGYLIRSMREIYWIDRLANSECFFLGSGGFSRERTNLPGLHQLHGRAIWIVEGAIRTYLWSGSN